MAYPEGTKQDKGITYSSKKQWHSSQDGNQEYKAEYDWSSFGIGLEDVVDLLSLSVTKRLLIWRQTHCWIGFDSEVEHMVREGSRGAERSEKEGCAERLS